MSHIHVCIREVMTNMIQGVFHKDPKLDLKIMESR